MITIQKYDDNKILIRAHYFYGSRLREIPDAVLDYSHSYWHGVAPLSSLSYIREHFKGEIYFKTPLWKLLGLKEPEKEVISYMGPEPEVPELKLTPYAYQVEGIKFMIDRLKNVGFCLNGDGVGLGKSLQSIATVKWFYENRGARKTLLICKKSIKGQWEEEIKRISGWEDMPIFRTGETKAKRRKAYKGIEEAREGILITNYHNFLYDLEDIEKVNYDLCIIDEAHCVKARNGKMNKNIAKAVSSKMTILLTGTPIMSRPDDIWGIVHLATPNYFGTYEEFEDRYLEIQKDTIYGEQIVGAKNLDELKDMMGKFLIMRTPDDVAIQLPKIRKAKNIKSDMDALQKQMNALINEKKDALEKRSKEILESSTDYKGRVMLTDEARAELNANNEKSKMYISSLQYVADDPAVFRFVDVGKGVNRQLAKMVPDSYKGSAKTEAFVDAVSELIDADEKVIVFCFYASAARMLKHHLEKIDGANPVMFTGDENEEERDNNVRRFRTDPDCRVIIGTDAMAEGLNLQVARIVIHYEQADNYARREQREGRARRIGSKYDSVYVTDFVSKGSFDEIRLEKLRKDYRLREAITG